MANSNFIPLGELSLQERIENCIANGPSNKTFGKRARRGFKDPKLFLDFLDAKVGAYFRRPDRSNTSYDFNKIRESSVRKVGQYSSYSQSHQDLFVREMVKRKRNGYYLEIGAFDAAIISNTYILETDYAWRGVSLEIDETRAENFNRHRKNKCMLADATSQDYGKIFSDFGFPKQIDYLSVDIEPPWNSLAALNSIPLDRYRFSVITYEHDRHLNGPEYMNLSRELLETHGYKLVVANVKNNGCDYEDWYVDPLAIPEDVWWKYCCSDIEYKDIFRSLASAAAP